MGFFDQFQRIKDPVRGSAQVMSTTRPPHAATSGNCRMHLVVTVPGHPAFPVDGSFIVRVARWPQAGMVLPIEASQSKPTKFKILWDEIGSWHDAAAAQAQQLADHLNQPGAGPAAPPPPDVIATMIAGALAAPGAAAPPPPASSTQARIEALERLAALRDSGALTHAEFEQEKARLLGG
jgi:hypothetical protein